MLFNHSAGGVRWDQRDALGADSHLYGTVRRVFKTLIIKLGLPDAVHDVVCVLSRNSRTYEFNRDELESDTAKVSLRV
jgi:hypothetical protein